MAFKPSEITREHVLKGIEIIKESNEPLTNGTRWEVIIDGIAYPPKEVMRFAREQYDGSKEWPRGGGWPTNEFLEKMGFEVKEKSNNPILNLIQNYKKHIQITQLKDEQYKWELVQEYSGKPNFNAVDFYEELKSIKFGNIIYVMGSYVIINLAKRKPEEVRTAFKMLFDENNDLTQRVNNFRTETLKIYRGLGETLQHHQDERTIAAYLTLHDSEKYTFYKSSFYKKYCQLIGIKEANKNEKYAHYLKLINNLIENYISLDNELINQVKSYLPNYYNGENHMLLAQDILYQMLEKENEVNYWIFQGNPKFYDVVGALQEDVLTTWKVATHKDKIKIGDKVILWLTGDDAGCYALARITSEVGKIALSEGENKYYKSDYDENVDRVSIEIEYNLADEPILWEEIKERPELLDLKVGNQGTNFSATEEQYKALMDWIESQDNNTSDEERLIARIKEIGISDSQKFYTIMENIVKGLSILEGDDRFCYSLPKNKLIGITIGRKYCAIIDRKQRKNNYRYFDTIHNEKNWLKQVNSLEDMAKEMDIIIQSANLELSKTIRTGYYSHSSHSLEKSLFDKEYKAFIFKKAFNTAIKTENMNTNLNQILFGPPGTGKTFNTINEALKIIDPIYFEANQNDRKKLTDRFKELLIKNTDENKGQIAFCTFHQSFSYEDFVEGIKPKTTDTKSVYYDTEPGVFKRICQLADSNNSTVKVIKEGKISWTEEAYKKAAFYKLSLGNYQNPLDKPIYEFCRDSGYIAIGFGQENDFTGLSESEIKEKCDDLKLEVTAAQQMNFFIHYLKKNNYVIVSNGNKYVRALGKVVGDYEYWEDSPIRYNHFRKVEWIFTDELIPIEEIYDRGLTQKTIYKIDESALKEDFFTNQGQQEVIEAKEEKKFVLIIDEINRGNVSSIFGELITLIEKDKRAGCEEELEVTLPYSKEPFKVPNNVYLIGTMNTADRSIEALDTALRRRFSFKEFPPKTYLIKTEGASGKVNGMVDGIDLEKLLIIVNNRIEKLIDKDHRIGHSYFLKVNNREKLIHAFKNEIIPLLEEYFFGDYGKIGLVLGNSFVEKMNHDFSFADFKAYDSDIQSDLKEKAVFRITGDSLWDFSTI